MIARSRRWGSGGPRGAASALAHAALARAPGRSGPRDAAVTAAVLISVYNGDRQTADRYREALDEAGGQYFQADRLTDEAGAKGGVLFGYEGSPSWVFVTVDPAHRGAAKTAELVTRDARTIPLRGFELDRRGTWVGRFPSTSTRSSRFGCSERVPGTSCRPTFGSIAWLDIEQAIRTRRTDEIPRR